MASTMDVPLKGENHNTAFMEVDFESDNETATVAHRSPRLEHTAQPMRPSNALSRLFESDEESEDEKSVAQVPKGKLLARLQPHAEGEASSSEEEDAEAAYERVKRALLTEKAPQDSPPRRSGADDEDDSESEDDVPVRASNTRRRISTRSSPPAPPSLSTQHHRASSGLFVTPNTTPEKHGKASPRPTAEPESDDSGNHRPNKDLNERVKRIRAERRARQQEQQRQQKRAKGAQHNVEQESDSDADGENGRRLTQLTRPTRKAGKKALEDMAREQQRISRNMQLTHQAKTKKRHSIKDLMSRLGYNQVDSELVPAAGFPTPDPSSALTSSDAEGNQEHTTPPASPLRHQHDNNNKQEALNTTRGGITTQLTPAPPSPFHPKLEKGKERALEFQHLPRNPCAAHSESTIVKNVPPVAANMAEKPVIDEMIELSDSDEDMQNRQPKSRFPVFDRVPQRKQQEAPSLLHLRHLAHLTSPSKQVRKGQSMMNTMQLHVSLAQKARQQAQQERAEKIEDLKRRGIHVETEEEREKNQLEIEDMVAQFEKARQEDLKLAKFEREVAKKNGESGDSLLSSDESEDDDHVGSGEEEVGEEHEQEELEVELSGSEDEDSEIDEDDKMMDETHGLLDDAAEETEEEEKTETAEQELPDPTADVDDEDISVPVRKQNAIRKRNIVLDDDEEESEYEGMKASSSAQKAVQTIPSQQDDAMAAFGFQDSSVPLGLTQMFAGTMANLESDSQFEHPLDKELEQDSLDFLRHIPDSQPTDIFSQVAGMYVSNSQAVESQQTDSRSQLVPQVKLGISQLIETSPAFSHTQLSEAPEPTQDAGFELSRSPAGLLPPPQSTVDTVMLSIAESPIVKRKGRLQRRKQVLETELFDADEDTVGDAIDVETGGQAAGANDAFSVMRKAAKKENRLAGFNKKTSWARDAVEEQAEESEDEYAGIGGASDEDSGEEDEELAKMIDKNDVKVDERELAAFYAEKEKATDEKNINQLYKDLMNGGLRKRRGGDAFDMSDSEDEIEQRRKRKQMQFRQMTKALVSDERIGKIAQNPKQSAFFRTLADHAEDPEYDFLNVPEIAMEAEPSQSESQCQLNDTQEEEGVFTEITVPDSQTFDPSAPVNQLKRKFLDSQEKENRPPPHLRRTAASDSMTRRPMTVADIQHSVSELLDDPRIVIPESQYSSDSDLEVEPAVHPIINRKPMIDRLSLSRQSTILSSTSTSIEPTRANMAFHTPSEGTHVPGFKVPSLIRRATSNLSEVSRTSSGASTPSTEGSGVRRGGTGRSNIHAQAREAERRAAVEKVEKRRKEVLRKKVGKARGKRTVLGCLDGGFE